MTKFETGKMYYAYNTTDTVEYIRIDKRTDQTVVVTLLARPDDPHSIDCTFRVKIREGTGCEWLLLNDGWGTCCDAADAVYEEVSA